MSVYTLSSSRFETGMLGLIALVIAAQSHAQNNSLDGSAHVGEIEFKSAFESKTLPLDASLPWRERFKGNEEFDEAFSLSGQMDKPLVAEKEMKSDEPVMTKPGFDGNGMVESVRDDKVKIAHGPIDKFGMPAMTMVFKVNDPKLLGRLQKGDDVNFNVDETNAGYMVSAIEKAGVGNTPAAMASDQSAVNGDATGTVKSVRMEQAKLKIEHGPIDKFGMPAMTMMFKVSDPKLLEGLEAGMQIEFDVDESAGGFVVTDIKR